MISHMREQAPDLGRNDSSVLNLRIAAQRLRDNDVADPLPRRLMRIIRSIGNDGREEDDEVHGEALSVRRRGLDQARITLHREWDALEKWARVRSEGAELLLAHLLQCLPPDARGTDLLAETTLGKLNHAIESDQILTQGVRSPAKLMERALLWLHEQEVIRLHKGLVVFRPAMKIRLEPGVRRVFTGADFEPLALHYQGQVLQIHVMVKFAERGLAAVTEAVQLAMDYFSTAHMRSFSPGGCPVRRPRPSRETTPESWQAIVASLNNPAQQNIVADQRKRTNVLVLAGPGSGKTRVLVHRIAYLVRVRRQDRLEDSRTGLQPARGGRDPAEAEEADRRRRTPGNRNDLPRTGDAAGRVQLHRTFRKTRRFLLPAGAPPCDRPAARRGTSAGGGRRAPRAAAGRLPLDSRGRIPGHWARRIPSSSRLWRAGRLDEDAAKLNLFAVGDDDQNIYAFKGASVEFIRRFEEDYNARSSHLDRQLPLHGTHHLGGQRVDRAGAGADEGRTIQSRLIGRGRRIPRAGSGRSEIRLRAGRVQILPVGSHPVEQAHGRDG